MFVLQKSFFGKKCEVTRVAFGDVRDHAVLGGTNTDPRSQMMELGKAAVL